MPRSENEIMNSIMRRAAGSSAATADEEAPPDEGKNFTVQQPGEESPPDQFIYEPLGPEYPGAWAVYPPGVPCDTGEARISRSTPAAAGDFAAMEEALAGATSTSALPSETAPTTEAAGVY